MGLEGNPCMGIAETHAWVLSSPLRYIFSNPY